MQTTMNNEANNLEPESNPVPTGQDVFRKLKEINKQLGEVAEDLEIIDYDLEDPKLIQETLKAVVVLAEYIDDRITSENADPEEYMRWIERTTGGKKN